MLTEEERARAATQRAANSARVARRRAAVRALAAASAAGPPATWLDWADVAALLGVSRTRVDALRNAGKLVAAKRRGGAWAYDPAAVAALRADRAARGVGAPTAGNPLAGGGRG